MKNKLTFFDYLLFIFALIFGVIFIFLYPRLYPTAGIKIKITAEEAVERATQYLNQLGYKLENYQQNVSFFLDQKQIQYLNKNVGQMRTNKLMQDSIQAAYWRVRWQKSSEIREIKIEASGDEQLNTKIENINFGEILVKLALNGDLIGFSVNLEDSIQGVNLGDSLAYLLASDFLERKLDIDLNNYHPLAPTVKTQPHRTDYVFKWVSRQKIAGESVEQSVTILGERVGAYELNYRIPESTEAPKSFLSEINNLLLAIVFLIYFFLISALFIKLLKSDSLSLKTGIFWGIFTAVALVTTMWLETINEDSLALVFALLIPPALLGFFTVLLFAVGDATTRQVWQEKLFTFDALRHRIARFPQFGNMLLRGLSGGLFITGLVSVLFWAGSHLDDFMLVRDNVRLEYLITKFSIFFVVARLLIDLINQEIVFRLITISYLRKHLKSIVSIIAISALAGAFSELGAFAFKTQIFIFDLLLGFTVAALIAFLFVRYDFLTAFLAALSSQLFFEGFTLLQYGHPNYFFNGLAVFILLGVLVVFALVAKLSKANENLELEKLSPPYVARMSERERLIRELEIARQVQLGFLPKDLPRIRGLEVASLCLPAKEVGGDYYDFVKLDENRLAIVIGDVSGKGISAAFYMTLMKGLLRAQARNEFSPRQVMVSLNELFYENVERGTFISMIYAVFDLKKRKITFARAGHNPVILKNKHETRTLMSSGLALGLEKGRIFNQTIEEFTLGFTSGDYFVFYTDGITEAMNDRFVEFGEDTLFRVIRDDAVASAEQLLFRIKSHVAEFVGKAPQHDDMTMVIMKINDSES